MRGFDSVMTAVYLHAETQQRLMVMPTMISQLSYRLPRRIAIEAVVYLNPTILALAVSLPVKTAVLF